MPSFGERSRRNLATCDPRIQVILNEAINHIDFAVIEGHRSNERQEELFHAGKSKLRAGQSKHNQDPSLAVDIVPWPVDWNDRERFALLAGIVKGIGHCYQVPLRWGGDFNRNNITTDQTFYDGPHLEIDE